MQPVTPADDHGLTSAQAAEQLATHGPNLLPEPEPESALRRLARQMRSPLIYILLVALAIDLGAWFRTREGYPLDSIAIGLILALNAILGFWQESKASAAVAKLRQLSAPQAWVRRDTVWQHLPASELVPGDWVRLEAGDRIPADGEVLDESVEVDESLLTGESLPVEKRRGAEVFSGSLAVRGKTHFRVTRTGVQSALGRLAANLGAIQNDPTPLERRLTRFGNQVAKWVLAAAVALAALLVLAQGWDHLEQSLLFAVALAVAAVPEGLPAVLSLTLALGVSRMAARKAVVRRLSAVEALGSVTVIATDKTGTLTENRLTVRSEDTTDAARLTEAVVLANDAEQGIGDPVDTAFLDYAERQGVSVAELRAKYPRVASIPFDSLRKFQRVTIEKDGQRLSYWKGAPEVLLAQSSLSPDARDTWMRKAESSAAQGLRVLGSATSSGESDTDIEFLGLVMLWDPPRPETPAAVQKAGSAGIRVMMLTGDHPATAAAVASSVGIDASTVVSGAQLEGVDAGQLSKFASTANVFARVKPEHKLQLVESLKASGEVVGMTGDGVNDAPALKRADVGIAMGDRGSDVAREVADVVLLDDNFATIITAVEEGRGIYENIQKFIRFLFSTNLAEAAIVSLGMILSVILGIRDDQHGLWLPLTAVQILWINLVTDGLPAVALILDHNPGVMARPPRPGSAPLLDSRSLRYVLFCGSITALVGMAILAMAMPGWLSRPVAQTALFHYVSVAQFFLVYPARRTFIRPSANPVLHGVVIGGIALQLAVGLSALGRNMFGLVQLHPEAWALVFGAALTAWLLAQAAVGLIWRGQE